MAASLQPIVAERQQLIIGAWRATVKPMVARHEIKAQFSRRMHEALDGHRDCPARHARGRRAWVARRYKVSNEAVSKWLDGRSIPDQTNMARICADLGVTPQWLHAGQRPKHPPPDDDFQSLVDLWPRLDQSMRLELIRFAEFLVTRTIGRAPVVREPRIRRNSSNDLS